MEPGPASWWKLLRTPTGQVPGGHATLSLLLFLGTMQGSCIAISQVSLFTAPVDASPASFPGKLRNAGSAAAAYGSPLWRLHC